MGSEVSSDKYENSSEERETADGAGERQDEYGPPQGQAGWISEMRSSLAADRVADVRRAMEEEGNADIAAVKYSQTEYEQLHDVIVRAGLPL